MVLAVTLMMVGSVGGGVGVGGISVGRGDVSSGGVDGWWWWWRW